MSEIWIQFNTEEALYDAQARLGELYEKAPDVLRKALNDTAKKTGRDLAELAQTRYTIKTVKFAKEFRYRFATRENLEAVLVSSGENLAASKFKTLPSTPNPSKNGSTPVKLAVLATAAPTTIENAKGLRAFLAKYQSGHVAVVQRKPYGSRAEYTPRGWQDREKRNKAFYEATGKLDKTRIREFYGPSVPTMLREAGIDGKFIETENSKVKEYLMKTITTHINREIHFANAK